MDDNSNEFLNGADLPHDEPAEMNAGQRLRAFEDETFGKDVPRINGHVERGHGSVFQRMTIAQKIRYAGLERLVKTEQEVADTSARLAKAEADHAAALAALDQAPAAPDGSVE